MTVTILFTTYKLTENCECVLCLKVLVQQLFLQSAVCLPLVGELPLGVAVLRVLPARLLLHLVQLALQGADPLVHLEENRSGRGEERLKYVLRFSGILEYCYC